MRYFVYFATLWGGLLMAGCTGRGPVIRVEGGEITGVKTETKGVLAYKGIPYAAPPVGDLRWREPQPVVSWDGVKRCDTFGAASVQESRASGGFYRKEFFWMGEPERSEDCLFLNLWTPASGKPEAKLPVAMWIHGGAYVQGYGHEIEFDGEEFARRGVILVTINYRLGALGFMAHPLLTAESENHTSGNYGFMDQRAALLWIKNNIAQFGGDPNNITIFGQSAGAGSVQNLLVSPLCKGLVSKAVMQSGGGLRGLASSGFTLSEAEATGKELMDSARMESLDQMRSISATTVCEMPMDFTIKNRYSVRIAPNIDGYFTPIDFNTAVREGHLPNIPYMIGYTEGDSRSLKESVGELSLLLEAQGRQPAYVYNFTRRLPGDLSGAFHSAELWYVFGTLNRSWRPFTDPDRDLSRRMIDYWTNFIKTGDPNGNNLAPWHPYTAANPHEHELNIIHELVGIVR